MNLMCSDCFLGATGTGRCVTITPRSSTRDQQQEGGRKQRKEKAQPPEQPKTSLSYGRRDQLPQQGLRSRAEAEGCVAEESKPRGVYFVLM